MTNELDRQTDTLMEVYKFRSGLTEVTGDGTYICITMSQICFETLTNNSPSRAASSQLKTNFHSSDRANNSSPVLIFLPATVSVERKPSPNFENFQRGHIIIGVIMKHCISTARYHVCGMQSSVPGFSS